VIHRALPDCEDRPVSHQPGIFKKVLLESGELPGLTNLSQAVFEPGEFVSGHSHSDMWEIFFVRSGGGRIRIDGVEAALEKDDCWVVEPGEVHEISNDGDTALVLLYFGLAQTSTGAR
jgi:quercetin dioxygenase-like cupin family protein